MLFATSEFYRLKETHILRFDQRLFKRVTKNILQRLMQRNAVSIVPASRNPTSK